MSVRYAGSWGQWRGWTWGEQTGSDMERQGNPPPTQSSPHMTPFIHLICLPHTFRLFIPCVCLNARLLPAKTTINGAFLCHLNVCAWACVPARVCKRDPRVSYQLTRLWRPTKQSFELPQFHNEWEILLHFWQLHNRSLAGTDWSYEHIFGTVIFKYWIRYYD